MRKFFAALFAILFVLLAPLAISATIIQEKVFSPAGIKQFIHRSQLAEQLPKIVSTALRTQKTDDKDGGDVFAEFGGQAVFEQAMTTVLPPQDVNVILDQLIDKGSIWWESGQPIEKLNLTIDLSSAKQRLTPIITQTIKKQIDELPTCSVADVQHILDQGQSDLSHLSCKPSGFSYDSLSQAGFSDATISEQILRTVPDQFDIQALLKQWADVDSNPLQQVNQSIDQARAVESTILIILHVLQIIVLVSFIAVGLLRLTPLRAFLTWIGWILFLPSLVLLCLFGAFWFAPSLLEQLILQLAPQVNEYLSLPVVVSSFLHLFDIAFLWVGLILFILGLSGIIVSRFLKRPTPRPVAVH